MRGTTVGVGLLLLVLCAAPAWAERASLDGFGRVTVAGGARLTPNSHSQASAREHGLRLQREGTAPLGVAVQTTFAYCATEYIEVAVELHGSGEKLVFGDDRPMTSITYGALLGLRLQKPGLLSDRLVPFAGLLTGPTLVYVMRPGVPAVERLTEGWGLSAGAALRISQKVGLTFEYRLLLARGWAPDIGSINAGGSFFTVGLTFYFPPESSGFGKS